MYDSIEETDYALRNSAGGPVIVSPDRRNQTSWQGFTDEFDVVGAGTLIDTCMEDVIYSKGDLYYVKPHPAHGSLWAFAKPLGKQLLRRVSDIQRAHAHYPLHTFNPYFQMLDRNTSEIGQWELPEEGNLLNRVDRYNEAVRRIRQEGNAKDFRYWLRSHKRRSADNLVSVCEYFREVFAVYSKILVLRIELNFLEQWRLPGTEDCVTYAEVKEYRERFLRDLRRTLPVHYVGYVWKLEYSVLSGFHVHVMILLDGQKARQDVVYAGIIGDHWSNVVTAGKGFSFNCNRDKRAYKRLGIGLVCHDDWFMRGNMEYAASYLIKPDMYIELVMPDGDRTFGKGNAPVQLANRLGRPRNEVLLSKNDRAKP
ncbi:inovirus-type Gp2 protein [Rhodanobacter sp. A1T4]|uniref:YagK/YfjJ domain-containing protein n=1 Tax=Rhodanobacter sp. A1T4 TaxID=2723087 RepID=UPI00160CEE27|nr:inovirus-type Gp2 protein [Rhodanobacter sp. A1T4]MBB6248986.1 hypothetical protein [Rhodanobacter sp. A1T4]